MNLRNIFYASIAVYMVSLAACFGGGSSSNADDSAQIATLQKTVAGLQKTVSELTDSVKTLQTNQMSDESLLSTVKQIGHIPGASASAAEQRFGIRTSAVAQAVDNTDYGICSDMGQFSGHGPADVFTGDITDLMKNCTGNKALLDSGTGKIGRLATIWFTQANCKGVAFEIPGQASIDRPTLAGGLIFESLMDNSVVWAKPLAAGTVPAQMQSQSIFNSGTCNVDVETGEGFPVVPNVTDGADGSGVPNGGVPNTYVYN